VTTVVLVGWQPSAGSRPEGFRRTASSAVSGACFFSTGTPWNRRRIRTVLWPLPGRAGSPAVAGRVRAV